MTNDATAKTHTLTAMTVREVHKLSDSVNVYCPVQADGCSYQYGDELGDYRREALLKWPWCERCGCSLVLVEYGE